MSEENVVIAISNGLMENFQETVKRLGITVQEVDEPDGWMDRIVDSEEDRRILKDILTVTDCPIKMKHYELSDTDYNFLRLNIDTETWKSL